MKIKFEWSDGLPFPNSKNVRVKVMNHLVEIVGLERSTNGLNQIQKLSADEYVIKATGEILEYDKSENRAENVAGLKKTFKKIRDLINKNYIGHESELHIVLTYGENMTDNKRLSADFDKFMKRLRYAYGSLEYLTIVEPQGRGAWHHHLLLKNTSGAKLFIPHADLQQMWGHGWVFIKSLKDIDNIGAYLSAYLGDVEIKSEKLENGTERYTVPDEVIRAMMDGKQFSEHDWITKSVDGEEKRFLKGGRCYMYPPGMNIYRKSKGVEHPVVEQMSYFKAKKIVGNTTPNYSKTLTITDDEGKLLNAVTYEQYNTKRSSKKDDICNTNKRSIG